jgi:hypothetical protein
VGAPSHHHEVSLPPARPTPATTLDDLRAGARRRWWAAVLTLPVGLLLAVTGAWAITLDAVTVGRTRLVVVACIGEVVLVVPRGWRRWRLRRAEHHDRRAAGTRVPVRIAVYPSAPLAALAAVVAVWPEHDPDGPPARVHAADRSAAPMADGGRMWATVVHGPHRFATYRLDDGTPVVAAGRTNVLQRWLVRARVRDLRRRGRPLDRRTDAPFPVPDVAGDVVAEVRSALAPMLAVAVAIPGVGLLIGLVGGMSAG